jgi:glycosyltransferase involved in cell wall biosynthesis
VIDRYEEALGLGSPTFARARCPRRLRAIHQLLPNLACGDAISNQATFQREVLRDLGYQSEIFVQDLDDRMQELGRPIEPGAIASSDSLLYHHSIGTALTPHAIRHRGPKALIYHNITPASFFEPWDPAYARLLETGRRSLMELAPTFPISAGDSEYNAAELRQAGFHAPRVLPIFVDPLRWDQPPAADWMNVLQDGRTNLLFVGRMAPNKCQHHLVEAFKEYLSHDPHARLVLVGGWVDGDPYAKFVQDCAHRFGIGSQVLLIQSCTDAQLQACYRRAHLFWSMSEHEGFCVPLVEAMWFDVPVLAYRSSAVPETLGTAGLMFTEKRWVELAALARLLVEDGELRRKVVASQRSRRSAFLPEAILPTFLNLVQAMDEDATTTRAAPWANGVKTPMRPPASHTPR